MINNIAIKQEKVTTFVSVFLNKKRLVENSYSYNLFKII